MIAPAILANAAANKKIEKNISGKSKKTRLFVPLVFLVLRAPKGLQILQRE